MHTRATPRPCPIKRTGPYRCPGRREEQQPSLVHGLSAPPPLLTLAFCFLSLPRSPHDSPSTSQEQAIREHGS
ncbi:hypothetical protein E2C01_098099 [Portunus trituberculatus]|uniref:Uncharacterized protein n=1 Tax=Portunus trituberculatus TaxID=210409 RepID=A0A5B7K677_PORTR|nr:hypothetical protein [Portunus trituberculatus]